MLEILTGICATLPDPADLEPGVDDDEVEDDIFEDVAAEDNDDNVTDETPDDPMTLDEQDTICYGFGYGMVQTACLFMVHVSGLIDSLGTGSNIFDSCPFSYCLYLVFPFLSRQSSLESPLVSSVLVFPFYGHFQRLLIRTYVG